MAPRKSNETGVVARGKQSVNSWEEDMARDAEIAAAQETLTGGGQFIGLAAGVLSFNGAPMPNNEMRCVILDSIFENVYYEGDYEAGNPTAPTCFAYGRYDRDGKTVVGVDTVDDIKEMSPHKTVLKPVCETCAECPMNQFGSAKTGRGKACKNTRRLALIPVQGSTKKGNFIIDVNDIEHYATAPMAYLKTPVMSTKIYSAFVTQVASALKRPPYGVFTKIYTQPNTESQFTVNFEAIDSIPNSLGKTIMERHQEAMAAIAFPYTQMVEEEPVKGGKNTKKKPAEKERDSNPAGRPGRGGKAEKLAAKKSSRY